MKAPTIKAKTHRRYKIKKGDMVIQSPTGKIQRYSVRPEMNKAPKCPKCKKGRLHETIIAGLPLSLWCDKCDYRESDPNG